MNNLNIGFSGEFKITITRNGNLIQETDWFDNLILDSGLQLLGQGSSPIRHVRVGTGTSVPLNTQVILDSQVASTTGTVTSSVNSGSPNYITSHTSRYIFAQGAVVGNITEVGTSSAGTGNLFSRTLITDTNGTPVTLTLLEIDQLTIYYKLNIAPPVIDKSGVVNISGTNYNYKSNVAYAGSFAQDYFFDYMFQAQTASVFDGAIGPVTGGPLGTSNECGVSQSVAGVNSKNFQIICGNGTGNFSTGIRSIVLSLGGPYQSHRFTAELTPPIIKTNTQVLTLNMTVSWGRG